MTRKPVLALMLVVVATFSVRADRPRAGAMTQIRSTDAQPSTEATRTSNPLLSAGRPPGPPLRCRRVFRPGGT